MRLAGARRVRVRRGHWALIGVCVVFVLLAPARAHAQTPLLRFERLTIEQGLSSNDAFSLLQDRAGFVWIGTADGLNRYDGYSVGIYKADPLDPGSLSNGAIAALLEDRDGAVWVATRRGVNRFNPQTNTFSRFLTELRISSLFEDAAGTLWAGTWGGVLARFDRATEQWTQLGVCTAGSGCLLYQDRAGAYWLADKSGLHRFDPASATVTPVLVDPAFPELFAFDLFEDRDGRFWIASDYGLYLFDRDGGPSRRYAHDPLDPQSLSSDFVWLVHQDHHGDLWVGSWDGGLDRFDPDSGTFVHHRSDPNNLHSLGSDRPMALLEDRGGLLWVATDGGGVSIVDPAGAAFGHYTDDPTQPQSMRGRVVSALFVDRDGAIWAGTDGNGLNVLDRAAGTVVNYRNDPADERSLSSDTVYAVHQAADGTIWVATALGLNRFEAGGTFRRFRRNPGSDIARGGDVVQEIVDDERGRLWLGTEDGLVLFDPGAWRVVREYHSVPDDDTTISGNDISALHRDATGRLWVGSWNGGLSVYDAATDRFRRFRYDPDDPEALHDVFITEVVSDGPGQIWIATSGGAERLDPATGQVRHITARNGLPSSAVPCLLPDDEGGMWLATGAGLAQLDHRAAVRAVYTARDGLQSNQFTAACAHGRGGELLFGGINGFNVFAPSAIARRSTPPAIAITGVRTGSNAPRPLLSTPEQVSLPYRDNSFAFDFAALDYADPAANTYAYMLEGFDHDWIAAGTRRTASYTNLDGGEYVFRVKAANRLGVWNDVGTAVRIHVAVAPWRSWWAYTLYGLAALGAVVGLMQYGSGRQRRRIAAQERLAAQLETLVDERTEERDQLFTLSHDLLCIAGTDGYFKRLNPAWESTLGYGRDELYAEPLLSFVHPEDRAATELAVHGGGSGQPQLAFENRYRCKNGEYRWLAWSATLVPERQLFYGVARDITARKLAEREQQQLYDVADSLRDVLSAINGNVALPEVLDIIVKQATQLLTVDAAQIYRLESAANGELFRVEATCGFRGDYLGTTLTDIRSTVSYRAVETHAPQAVADTRELLDTILARPAIGAEQQQLVTETQRRFQALLALPLLIDGLAYGTLTLYNAARRSFSDAELALATAFASQSTLAIANARLREHIEHAAVAEERGRLARSLHDSVTQALYSLGLLAGAFRFEAGEQGQSGAAENYDKLGRIAQQALQEMRLLIYQLRTPLLEQEGLIAALQQRLDTVERGAGVRTRLLTGGELSLAPQVEEELYWISQEALNNVLKHAAAQNVTLRVEHADGALALSISDDGAGFDALTSPRGVGLSSMHERAARIGATITLQSAQGSGTTVIVRLPQPQQQGTSNERTDSRADRR